MDNGQHRNFPAPQPGDISQLTNNLETNNLEAGTPEPDNTPPVDDNLNAENWQRSLEISAPVDMPKPESILSEATKSSEALNPGIIIAPESTDKITQPAATTELGQVTTIENAISVSPVAKQFNYNPTNIKTSGDHLEKSSISEIDNAITELNQTGDLNNFYNEIRGEGGMTEVNLNNSFNRKLFGKGEEQ